MGRGGRLGRSDGLECEWMGFIVLAWCYGGLDMGESLWTHSFVRRYLVSALLSFKPPYARWVRDDITVQVVFFE